MEHEHLRLVNKGRQREFRNLMRRAAEISQQDAADEFNPAAHEQRKAEIREFSDKFVEPKEPQA